MNKILPEYKKRCRSEFKSIGFKMYRNICYRIVNDVYQAFEISFYRGKECEISFGIIPICGIINNKHRSCCGIIYELSWIRTCGRHRWEYDKESFASIENCVNQLFDDIHKFIIPIMEKGVNAETALECIISLDKRYFNKIRWIDPNKYFIFLKLGDYEKAIQVLEAMRQQWIRALIGNATVGYKNNDSDFILRVVNKTIPGIEKFDEEIKKIKCSDSLDIEKMLAENEKLTLENLKWK